MATGALGPLALLWLAIRSVAWAVLLPGVVAGYVPWRLFELARSPVSWHDPLDVLGVASLLPGIGLLTACIWKSALRGRGTPSPVDPPTQLVVQGLYRHVRNPMYLSVIAILLGEILITRSVGLFTYGAVWFAAVNLFVIGYEEPTLRRQFGASYHRYAAAVGRWIPRAGR